MGGFGYYLAGIYELINKFTEQDAHNYLPAGKKYPKKDEGFVGPLLCGYAKYPGHIKPKTGLPYWHCDFKFAFDYYVLLNENGKVLKSVKEEEKLKGLKGTIEKGRYKGCPAHTPDRKLRAEHEAKGMKIDKSGGDDVGGDDKIIDNFDF